MENNDIKNELIIGRNALAEALKSGVEIDKVYYSKNLHGSAVATLKKCRDLGLVVKEVSLEKLNFLAHGKNHQGIVASLASFSYSVLDDVFRCAEDKGVEPFVVICDEIEDPHNLGAIIRCAEVMGATGVIIPKRRSASLTATVSKTSAGALMHIPVVRVNNLSATIDELKNSGLWIYGAQMSQSSIYDTDFSGAVGLVIGSEGKGISRLVQEKCDFLVSIPMYGKINSLNASVAAGIIMSQIAQHRFKNSKA